MRERLTPAGRRILPLIGAAALLVSCSPDDSTGADPTTTTTPVAVTIACADGSAGGPVVLEDAPGVASVIDVVARPSGQLVAVGTSMWTRERGARTWQSAAGGAPGAPDQRATAAVVAGDEVWVATNDAAGLGAVSQIHRSSDLATWTADPVVLDGTPRAVAINGMAQIGDRWYALIQDSDQMIIAATTDGRAWESRAALPLQGATGPGKALFEMADLAGEPTSVGFTVGDALGPLVVGWPPDGTAEEQILDQDALASVRLWGLATTPDQRVVLAADRVATDPTGEATGFTAELYERADDGSLDLLTALSSPRPFAAPSDLVIADDQVVVVGAIGDARRALVPVVWTVCLAPG